MEIIGIESKVQSKMVKRIKKSFPRPCKRCGKKIPNPTKYQTICIECFRESREKAKEKWKK